MKKIVKILLITLLIMILLLIINVIRNYTILTKIRKAGNNLLNLSNYHITIKSTSNIDDNEVNNVYNDIYYKDNIYVINTYISDELTEFYWKDFSTGEDISYNPNMPEYDAKFNEDLIKMIKNTVTLNDTYDYAKLLFNIISEKDGYYIISYEESGWKVFYDKKTGILKKDESQMQISDENKSIVNSISEYSFEENAVSDENIKKPER